MYNFTSNQRKKRSRLKHQVDEFNFGNAKDSLTHFINNTELPHINKLFDNDPEQFFRALREYMLDMLTLSGYGGRRLAKMRAIIYIYLAHELDVPIKKTLLSLESKRKEQTKTIRALELEFGLTPKTVRLGNIGFSIDHAVDFGLSITKDYSQKTRKEKKNFKKELKRIIEDTDGGLSGTDPFTYLAAACYVASKYSDCTLIQKNLAWGFGVSEVAIRLHINQYKTFEDMGNK